jgi:hypothetical protein
MSLELLSPEEGMIASAGLPSPTLSFLSFTTVVMSHFKIEQECTSHFFHESLVVAFVVFLTSSLFTKSSEKKKSAQTERQ